MFNLVEILVYQHCNGRREQSGVRGGSCQVDCNRLDPFHSALPLDRIPAEQPATLLIFLAGTRYGKNSGSSWRPCDDPAWGCIAVRRSHRGFPLSMLVGTWVLLPEMTVSFRTADILFKASQIHS